MQNNVQIFLYANLKTPIFFSSVTISQIVTTSAG